MGTYVFGVDVGGTTVKLGLFDPCGEMLEKWEINTNTNNNGKFILNDISESIFSKIDERKLRLIDIEGIGIGVPGPVLSSGVVQKCVNLGWDVVDVKVEMENLTGLRVEVGNDANVAALGEMWQGGGKGYKNLVMVTLGTGVGGGVVVAENIIAGSDGAAGEIGHLLANEEEEEFCTCGNRGCLEQYASATGIVRVANNLISCESGRSSILANDKNMDAKSIFEAVRKNDKVAKEAVETLYHTLGKSLAQIACVCNPQVFVIGGGMSKEGDVLIEGIKKYYQRYSFHASKNTYFKIAKLGNDAGVFGAAKMILQ